LAVILFKYKGSMRRSGLP